MTFKVPTLSLLVKLLKVRLWNISVSKPGHKAGGHCTGWSGRSGPMLLCSSHNILYSRCHITRGCVWRLEPRLCYSVTGWGHTLVTQPPFWTLIGSRWPDVDPWLVGGGQKVSRHGSVWASQHPGLPSDSDVWSWGLSNEDVTPQIQWWEGQCGERPGGVQEGALWGWGQRSGLHRGRRVSEGA